MSARFSASLWPARFLLAQWPSAIVFERVFTIWRWLESDTPVLPLLPLTAFSAPPWRTICAAALQTALPPQFYNFPAPPPHRDDSARQPSADSRCGLAFLVNGPGTAAVLRKSLPIRSFSTPALARRIARQVGDAVVVHVQKPSLLSLEAPISPQEDVSTGIRVNVSAVVTDAHFGRFGLQANQASPMSAFLPLAFLQAKVDQASRVNLLLIAGQSPDIERRWTLADADLEFRDVPGGLELRTGRVFIDPPTVAAAKSIACLTK